MINLAELIGEDMSKSIVFCADGTWNGDSEDPDNTSNATNVLKLFHNLAGTDTLDSYRLADEQERILTNANGDTLQIAKYLHGVGDSSNALVRLFGGALGSGLIARIVRGYTFISRNYEPGDAIHLIGFSRGAYTVRSLAGMIAAQGLLSSADGALNDKDDAYMSGAAVWYAYRKSALISKENLLGRLEDLVGLLPGFVSRRFVSSDSMVTGVRISDVSVWETVGAMGIPQFDKEGAYVEALRFTNTVLSESVLRGIHAVSLDERRKNFPPCLWEPDERILQTLFPGAHSDVGGGYPLDDDESGLSDGALEWMMHRLDEQNVLFSNVPAVKPSPNACGTAHQPWLHSPWVMLGESIRVAETNQMLGGLTLHPSISARMAAGGVIPDPGLALSTYSPSNLQNYDLSAIEISTSAARSAA